MQVDGGGLILNDAMGIYSEKSIPRWAGVIILIAAFIAIYQPWLLGDRELFRLEGLYAV